MQFLYRIKPTRPAMLVAGPTPGEAATVSAHFAYLTDLAARGVVILAGRTQTTDEQSFGMVIFNADSEEGARAIVAGDPAPSGGVMAAELFPYRIAILRGENA